MVNIDRRTFLWAGTAIAAGAAIRDLSRFTNRIALENSRPHFSFAAVRTQESLDLFAPFGREHDVVVIRRDLHALGQFHGCEKVVVVSPRHHKAVRTTTQRNRRAQQQRFNGKQRPKRAGIGGF